MRALAGLLALITVAAAAWADEARNVPATGSKLTYRLITQTIVGGKTITAGMVYTYIVTASDGAAAEGVIKPVARIIHCDGGAADLACRDVPNSRIEGDLLTQSIGGDAAEALAKHSHFKLAYFLPEERRFPFPASRDPQHAFGEIGPDPDFVLTNTLKCDSTALAAFMPIGKAPHIALECETSVERTPSQRHNIAAQASREPVSYDITYAGDGWVTLPSGNWPVKKLAFKTTPKDPDHLAGEGETLFSPQLGAVIKTHAVGKTPAASSTTETTVELISVEP